jgi:hypothetical protein
MAGAEILARVKNAFCRSHSGHFPESDGFLWKVARNFAIPVAEDESVRIQDDGSRLARHNTKTARQFLDWRATFYKRQRRARHPRA